MCVKAWSSELINAQALLQRGVACRRKHVSIDSAVRIGEMNEASGADYVDQRCSMFFGGYSMSIRISVKSSGELFRNETRSNIFNRNIFGQYSYSHFAQKRYSACIIEISLQEINIWRYIVVYFIVLVGVIICCLQPRTIHLSASGTLYESMSATASACNPAICFMSTKSSTCCAENSSELKERDRT
jgi:hypothetical protein